MSSHSPVFRPVANADLEALLALMTRLYQHEGLPFDASVARSAAEDLMSHPDWGGIWRIEVEQALAGYIVLTLGYSLEFHGRDALIDELYVEPDWQGRGLGTQAIAFAAAECRARGVRALHLQVGHDNPRALALYERSGFRVHERHFMTKWITG